MIFKKSSIPYRLKTFVTLRDKGMCQCCGKVGKIRPRFGCYFLAYEKIYGDWVSFDIGHIYPESLGGETTAENLLLMCRRCNRRLGANYAL